MESDIQERKIPITHDELAILEFTNDDEHDRILYEERMFDYPYGVVLTGKDSYFWAVALAIAVGRFNHVSEHLILDAYDYAVTNNIGILREKYCSTKLDYYSESNDRYIFEVLLKDFLLHLDCPQIELKEIIHRTQNAFDSLLKNGLIEDPLEIAAGAVTVGVLGFIPYGFTTKTRRGRVVYRKISAGYWTYERNVRNGVVETNFNFRLVKLLRAFKKALIEVSQEGMDDPSK